MSVQAYEQLKEAVFKFNSEAGPGDPTCQIVNIYISTFQHILAVSNDNDPKYRDPHYPVYFKRYPQCPVRGTVDDNGQCLSNICQNACTINRSVNFVLYELPHVAAMCTMTNVYQHKIILVVENDKPPSNASLMIYIIVNCIRVMAISIRQSNSRIL